ncbi:enoyl-CoA hydratase-related protein [Streptomyces caeruleatus]
MLGVIPGVGGTQRLACLVGRVRAMGMVLAARPMCAREAERAGLVSRVVPDGLVPTGVAHVATTLPSGLPCMERSPGPGGTAP